MKTRKMISTFVWVLLPITFAAPVQTWGGEDMHHNAGATPIAPGFEKMKKLVGKWQGTTVNHEKEPIPAAVEYQLTSGGNVIVEKLFPGTPHEMMSVFYADGAQTKMTHYCTMGNRPAMELKSSGGNELSFEVPAASASVNPNELHMHGLTIYLVNADTITEKWTSFEKGKLKDSTVIKLSRVK